MAYKPPISDDELGKIINAEYEAATSNQDVYNTEREELLLYYKGQVKNLPPATDRSSTYVTDDVANVVDGLHDALTEMFADLSEIISFTPLFAGDDLYAEQETLAVQYLLAQLNKGDLIVSDVLKDGLSQRAGYAKFWIQLDQTPTFEEFYSITEEQIRAMQMNGYEVVKSSPVTVSGDQVFDGDGLSNELARTQIEVAYDVVFKYVERTKTFKWQAVAPEDVFHSLDAVYSLQDATYVGVRSTMTVDELIQIGVPKRLAIDLPISSRPDSPEQIRKLEDHQQSVADRDDTQRKVDIIEHWVRHDCDDDNVPEIVYALSHVDAPEKVLYKRYDPIVRVAGWTAKRDTHRFVGTCPADEAHKYQRLNTSITRGLLDNIYFTNYTRVEVSESHSGPATISDLLNNSHGSLIRTKLPGGINPLTVQPIVAPLMQVLEYIQSTLEQRTGATRYNQGLDASSLNKTAHGVQTIMDASQLPLKGIARNFVNMFLADAMIITHTLAARYSLDPFQFPQNGQFIVADPLTWKTRKHLVVNVSGPAEKNTRYQMLSQLLDRQGALMQQGPNPLVDWPELYNTARAMLTTVGVKTPNLYIKDPKLQPPQQPQPPQPDPTAIAVTRMQSETQLQKAQQEAAVTLRKAEMDAKVKLLIAANNKEIADRQMSVSSMKDITTEIIAANAKTRKPTND